MTGESGPNAQRPHRFASRKRSLVKFAKILIALLVAAGLYIAAESTLGQWRSESEKLRSRIAEVDDAISQTTHATQREALKRQRELLQATVPSPQNMNWGRVALASLLYGLGLLPPALVLRRALLSLGEDPRRSTAVAAQILGHLGKYVPGKAMVVILRAGVLSRDGVRPVPATVSIFMETFLMMAVGAAVAGVVVFWLPVPGWIASTAVCVAVVAGLPTLPPILKLVAARVTKVKLSDIDSKVGVRLCAAGWGWSIVAWLLVGASFACLITAIPSSAPSPVGWQLFAVSTAAISLAMVVGFASLLPGGAGVRELVLISVLSVSIGNVHALLSAIAARLMFIIVESTLAGGVWIWLRYSSDGRPVASRSQ